MVQFNYPSDGIGRKARKKYTFANFRGVDTSVAPINVDPVRAVESINFVDRNGVLHKRYGWEQVYQFDGAVNGFWKIILGSTTYVLCYAGNKFYLQSSTEGWKEVYTSDRLVSRRTACYVSKDSAYFIGCGDFLVFRYDDTTGAYAFFRVVDDAKTYIPTTMAQILPSSFVETGRDGQYVRDGVNILTGWRKNTLVGAEIGEDGKLNYKLDGNPSFYDADEKYLPVEITYNDKTYKSKEVYKTETTVDLFDSVEDSTVTIKKKDLYDETEYPDITYSEIPVSGDSHKDWVFMVSGKNGNYGLRWYREDGTKHFTPKTPSDPSRFRVYVLYFVDSRGTKKVSALRRIFRENEVASISDAAEPCTVYVKVNNAINAVEYTVSRYRLKGKALSVTVRIEWSDGDEDEKRVIQSVVKIPAEKDSVSGTLSLDSSDIRLKGYELEGIYTYEELENGKAVSIKEVSETHNVINELGNDVSYTFSVLSSGGGAVINCLGDMWESVLTFKKTAHIFDEEGLSATFDDTGWLSVSKWDAPDSGGANVTVKFYTDVEKADWIATCKYSTLYGVDGETDRLFLTNGDDESKGNIIFFSELDDFSYFPDEFAKAVGGSTSEVQGFIRLANGEMAALKTLSPNEATVFVFNGEYMTGYYDSEGYEKYTLPKFSTSGVSTTQGIVAPYACANLADDSMFLSQNGVYALELSQGTDSQRFAKERSLPINNLLKECNTSDLQNACAITHENKYYLAVKHYKQTSDELPIYSKKYYEKTKEGYIEAISINLEKGMSRYYEAEDVVYIADAHYSYAPMGAMADAPSYEWYPMTGVPVRVWLLFDGKLYFGTEDGKICRFVEDTYCDTKKTYFANNPEAYEAKSVSQSTVNALSLSGETLAYGTICTNTFSIGMFLDVRDVSDNEYLRDTIVFISGELEGFVYDERKSLIGRELYIKKVYRDGVFTGDIQLLYDEDGEAIDFPEASDLVAEIRRRRIVKASRTTPTFDFGMPDYLKTLESFTVVMNGTSGGAVAVDILTRNNAAKSSPALGGTRYSALQGLNAVSFNVPFQSSYTKKVRIRNFNYMMIKTYNNKAEDCSLSSISTIYKYNCESGGMK